MDNPFWDKQLTIYTRFYDTNTKLTKWYRYIAKKCFYTVKKVNVLNGVTIENKNSYIVRIPSVDNYLSYSDWCEEVNKGDYLSIAKGSLIFNADIADIIPDNNSGNELLKKYDGQSFRVSICKENSTFGLKHYFASGE